MNKYIATFFSHFGAVRFHKLCLAKGWQSQLAPVPRALSSSCGTCVIFTTDALAGNTPLPPETITPELEQLVLSKNNGYSPLFQTNDI